MRFVSAVEAVRCLPRVVSVWSANDEGRGMKIEEARAVIRPLVAKAKGTHWSLQALQDRRDKTYSYNWEDDEEILRELPGEVLWAYLLLEEVPLDGLRERMRWQPDIFHALDVLHSRAYWKVDVARGVRESTVPEDYTSAGTPDDGIAEAFGEGGGNYDVSDPVPWRGRGRPRKPAVGCSTPGCSRDAKSKGLCWRCYKRRQRSVQG
jgi:hypothetical protein